MATPVNQPLANGVATKSLIAYNSDPSNLVAADGGPNALVCSAPARYAEVVQSMPPDHLAYVERR